MNPIALIEILLWLTLVYIVVIQLVLPIVQGRPVFPWFRRSQERQLIQERARLHQEEYEQSLRDEIEDLRRQIEHHKREARRDAPPDVGVTCGCGKLPVHATNDPTFHRGDL